MLGSLPGGDFCSPKNDGRAGGGGGGGGGDGGDGGLVSESDQKNAQVHLGVCELGRTVAGMIRIVKIYCRCRPDQKGG